MPLLTDSTVTESAQNVVQTINKAAKKDLYIGKKTCGCDIKKIVSLMFVAVANYNELDIATSDCNCLKSSLNFTQSCE